MDATLRKEMERGLPKKKQSTRGSVNNRKRLAAFAKRRSKGDADWGSCDSERLQAVVVRITAMGGAITLSLSRDQGAHGLTLLLDDEKQTLWFNGDADLNEGLDNVLGVLESEDV